MKSGIENMETTSQVQEQNIQKNHIISIDNYKLSVQKWTEIIKELEGKPVKRTVYDCGFCEEFKGEKDFDEEAGEYTQECEFCPLFKAKVCVNNANSVANEADGYAFWEYTRAYNHWKYESFTTDKRREEARKTALRYAKKILKEIKKNNPETVKTEATEAIKQ